MIACEDLVRFGIEAGETDNGCAAVRMSLVLEMGIGIRKSDDGLWG